METTSIKDFAKAKGFVQITKAIRVNVNGYPYVTFIDSDNKSENIYFSKGAAMSVSAGQSFATIASEYEVCVSHNANGEERVKICRKSDIRVSIDDMFE